MEYLDIRCSYNIESKISLTYLAIMDQKYNFKLRIRLIFEDLGNFADITVLSDAEVQYIFNKNGANMK